MLMLLSARRTPWTSNRLSCFFYFKWQCLYNTRNLKLSPGPYHLALGHQLTPCTATPCPPENTSEDARGCPVWAEVRKGLAQRHRDGLRRPGSLFIFEGKKWNSHQVHGDQKAGNSVFRRLVLQLQMAHSHRSHQPPMHSHIPTSEMQTLIYKLRYAHTSLCCEPIWEWKEASLEVLPSWDGYINRWRRRKRRG